jgi:hypothetical protein
MIKRFVKGDILKNSDDGSYNIKNPLWANGEELSLSGFSKYDNANEYDFNRPIKDLEKNDETLERIIKILIESKVTSGINRGCELSIETNEWIGTSSIFDIDPTTITTKLASTEPESIPFIIPYEISSSTNAKTLLDANDISIQLYDMNDGLIIGTDSDFYFNYYDITLLESALIKLLKLETWKNDSIKIEYGDVKKFKINIIRNAKGASLDTQYRSLTNFEFDYINYTGELLEELITNGFNIGQSGTEVDLTDLLYFKFYNRFSLTKASLGDYLWNFLVLNHDEKRIEIWSSDNASTVINNINDLTTYSRILAFKDIENNPTIASTNYTLLCSIPVDNDGIKIASDENILQNPYQNCGFKNLATNDSLADIFTTSYTSSPVHTTHNFYFQYNLDEAGLKNGYIEIKNDTKLSEILDKLNLLEPTTLAWDIINGDLVVNRIGDLSESPSIYLAQTNIIRIRLTDIDPLVLDTGTTNFIESDTGTGTIIYPIIDGPTTEIDVEILTGYFEAGANVTYNGDSYATLESFAINLFNTEGLSGFNNFVNFAKPIVYQGYVNKQWYIQENYFIEIQNSIKAISGTSFPSFPELGDEFLNTGSNIWYKFNEILNTWIEI